MKNRIFISIICLVLSVPSLAQKAQWVTNVKAEATWDVTGNCTLNEAKENALYEAKKAAMRKASVGTSVRSVSYSAIASGGESADEESFAQINSFYISGRVKLCGEPVYSVYPFNDIIRVGVSIVADVLKDQPTDKTFVLKIDGFNQMYHVGENITFSVRSSKDCYLRVFWFDDTTTGKGSILYPIVSMERDEMLQANKVYNFPLSKDFDYETTLPAGKKKEQSFIFVMATTRQIPYMADETSFADFFKWYYDIDSTERTEYHAYSFVTVK